MLDGKFFDALTDNDYAARCNNCGEIPQNMNNLNARTVTISYLPFHHYMPGLEALTGCYMFPINYKPNNNEE